MMRESRPAIFRNRSGGTAWPWLVIFSRLTKGWGPIDHTASLVTETGDMLWFEK